MSLKKNCNENVTKYIIHLIALRSARQIVDDALIIAMVLKDLSEYFNPFSIHVTHNSKELTFSELKTELRSFENTTKTTQATTT